MEGTSLLKNVYKQKLVINDHFNRDVVPISMAGRNGAYSSGIIFKFNGKTWKYTNIPNFVAYLAGYDSTLLNNPYFFDLSGDPYETTNLIDSSDFNIQNAVTYGISLLQKSFSEGVPSFVDTVSSNYCTFNRLSYFKSHLRSFPAMRSSTIQVRSVVGYP